MKVFDEFGQEVGEINSGFGWEGVVGLGIFGFAVIGAALILGTMSAPILSPILMWKDRRNPTMITAFAIICLGLHICVWLLLFSQYGVGPVLELLVQGITTGDWKTNWVR